MHTALAVCCSIFGEGILFQFISVLVFGDTSHKMSENISPAFLVCNNQLLKPLRDGVVKETSYAVRRKRQERRSRQDLHQGRMGRKEKDGTKDDRLLNYRRLND